MYGLLIEVIAGKEPGLNLNTINVIKTISYECRFETWEPVLEAERDRTMPSADFFLYTAKNSWTLKAGICRWH